MESTNKCLPCGEVMKNRVLGIITLTMIKYCGLENG